MSAQANSPTDIAARFDKTIQAGVKLKTVMLKRGLVSAKAKCPLCDGGFLHGRLAGSRKHLRMWCDGCDVRMME